MYIIITSIFLFLIDITLNECISQQALQVIGFETSYQQQLKIENPILCKQFYKDFGTCVDQNDTKTIIIENQQDLKQRFDINKELVSVLESLQELVNQDQLKQQQIENIKQNLNQTQTDCFQALDQINQGVLCLLTSAKASLYTELDINQIRVKVDNQTTGKKLNKCMGWYDIICLITSGVSISQDIKLSNDIFMSNFEKYGAACENLKLQYHCTDCTQQYKALIEGMQPIINDFFPTKNQLDQLKKNVESLKENTLQWISGLLTKNTNFDSQNQKEKLQKTQILLISDDEGDSVVQTQLDQGIPFIQLSRSIIFGINLYIILFFNNQFYGGKS